MFEEKYKYYDTERTYSSLEEELQETQMELLYFVELNERTKEVNRIIRKGNKQNLDRKTIAEQVINSKLLPQKTLEFHVNFIPKFTGSNKISAMQVHGTYIRKLRYKIKDLRKQIEENEKIK